MVLVSTTTTTSFDRTGGPFSPWTWKTRGTQSVTTLFYGVYLCIYYLANILRSFVCTLQLPPTTLPPSASPTHGPDEMVPPVMGIGF